MNREENSISVFTGNEKYAEWVQELKQRYLSLRMRASLAANSAVLQFYWSLGEDIARMYPGRSYGSKFFEKLSIDLRHELPGVTGLSKSNLIYAYRFYNLYAGQIDQCNVGQSYNEIVQRTAEQYGTGKIVQRIADKSFASLLSLPWRHHQVIIDKVKGNVKKALFFVEQDIENNWSRDVLANFLMTDLYERQGKAITNFAERLPQPQGELAQDITRDPRN